LRHLWPLFLMRWISRAFRFPQYSRQASAARLYCRRANPAIPLAVRPSSKAQVRSGGHPGVMRILCHAPDAASKLKGSATSVSKTTKILDERALQQSPIATGSSRGDCFSRPLSLGMVGSVSSRMGLLEEVRDALGTGRAPAWMRAPIPRTPSRPSATTRGCGATTSVDSAGKRDWLAAPRRGSEGRPCPSSVR
jgi:hypothetical protein